MMRPRSPRAPQSFGSPLDDTALGDVSGGRVRFLVDGQEILPNNGKGAVDSFGEFEYGRYNLNLDGVDLGRGLTFPGMGPGRTPEHAAHDLARGILRNDPDIDNVVFQGTTADGRFMLGSFGREDLEAEDAEREEMFSENIEQADMDLGQAFRENELSANIEQADMDLGQSFRESEFSANIEQADMDLGQSFRENEFSANIDQADMDLGQSFSESEMSANIEQAGMDLGAAMMGME